MTPPLIAASEFPFAVINDLHYTGPATRPPLDALVDQLNRENPDLVLVLGDLAELGSAEELAAARQILSRLNAPFYCVPGNHDGPLDRPVGSAATGLATYDRLFPDRRNYFFIHKSWQFLALDTTNGSGYANVPLTEETRRFARRAAADLDPHVPTILFTHFPLHPAVKYTLANGPELLQILAPLNLRIVFSGHFHGLTENTLPAPFPAHLRLLTNRCCSPTRELHEPSAPRGYFSCRTRADQSLAYTFVPAPGVIISDPAI